MNSLSIFTLKALRKIYTKIIGDNGSSLLHVINDADKANDIIYNLLAGDKPCMIARFGSTELSAIINYLGVTSKTYSVAKFIRREQPEWWWNKNIMNQMKNWSGFFPVSEENLSRFSQMMLEDAKEMDVCGIFSAVKPMIHFVEPYMKPLIYLSLYTYSPFTSKRPWSRILKGKNVLVIHPFAELIKEQYGRREQLFDNHDVLPDFNLKIIKAVQSLGGDSNGFSDWFEALKYMEDKMDRTDYDICLIGCGAYGFPLAAYAKRMGKKAVHIGGELQLLFGIKGARWEEPDAASKWGLPKDYYLKLFKNKAWVRPNKYRNNQSSNVENACYW